MPRVSDCLALAAIAQMAMVTGALAAPLQNPPIAPAPPATQDQPAPQPGAAAPAGPGAAREAMARMLLDNLAAARTEAEAASLEARINTLWINAGTPAVSLLVGRALRELSDNAPEDALEDINAALDLQSDFAAAWTVRAAVQAALGQNDDAVRDVQAALRLEPRSFGALQTLSHIAEARGDWKGALAAWQKVLELSPHTPGGAQRLADLRRHALGEEM